MKLQAALAVLLLAAPAAVSAGDATDPRPHGILAHVDPALLAPHPIAVPVIGATIGIPKVITWAAVNGTAGIAWGSTSAITAANAYVSYDGTNMLFNVPTGDGFALSVNNVEVGAFSTAGALQIDSNLTVSGGVIATPGTMTLQASGANAFDITVVSTVNRLTPRGAGGGSLLDNWLIDGIADEVQLTVQGHSTQTTLPFVVENSAGTDQFTVSNAGAVVALGSLTLTGTAALNAAVVVDGSADAIQLRVQANATQNSFLFVAEDSAGADIFAVGLNTNAFTAYGTALIDGASDNVQLTVQGNATQTTLPFVVENSAGVDQFTVSNAGVVVALGTVTLPVSGDALILDNGGTEGIEFAPNTANRRLRIFNTGGNLQIASSVGGNGGSATAQFQLNDNGGNTPFIVQFGDGSGAVTSLQLVTPSAVAANLTTLRGQVGAAHISGGGGSTTGAALGTGCGTSSAATQAGNDIGGTLGATCGTAGTTTNPFVTVTFADAYSTAPFCTIDPANAATAAGVVLSQHYAVTTTTTLAVYCGGGVCTTGTLLWAYHCTQ